MRLSLAVVTALGLSLGLAHANGRNPHTVGIYTKKGDAQTLYVATTFGLVVSKDAGCTFHWVCEQNIGYGGTWDPTYAVAIDGTIFATTFEGLRVSRDGGCSFTTASSTAKIWIDAIAMGPNGEIWIGTAETAGMNDVLASTDNGVTFTSRGMASAEKWWKSVVIAPSDAKRVYITGYQVAGTPTAYFYRSDDGGTKWTPSPLANLQYASTPVLRARAVDPANPDIVYMSSEAANPPTGDRLYRSTDGGTTWSEVLATTASVHDVVVRDAQTVFVATQIRTTNMLTGGPTYKSTDGGLTFTQMEGVPQMACLTQDANGDLLGCGANWDPDFKAVARSTDGGATWTKQWRFIEMQDALQCPEGTEPHDTCDRPLWDRPGIPPQPKRQPGATGAPRARDTRDEEPGRRLGVPDPVGGLWAFLVALLVMRSRRRRASR